MKKILVLTDLQVDFITGVLGTEEAKKIIPYIVNKIKNFDGKIIVTLDTHDKDYLNTIEGKKLPITHCIKWTSGWLLHEDIMNALEGKDFTVIEKSSFGTPLLITEISNYKKDDEIEIEFVGLCTEICVISNVLLTKAFYPEAKIVVDANGCAGVTPEKHLAALSTMESCHIDIIR